MMPNILLEAWWLELPQEGGRIIADDERNTIVYEPNASPWNRDENRVAKALLAAKTLYTRYRKGEMPEEVAKYLAPFMEELN